MRDRQSRQYLGIEQSVGVDCPSYLRRVVARRRHRPFDAKNPISRETRSSGRHHSRPRIRAHRGMRGQGKEGKREPTIHPPAYLPRFFATPPWGSAAGCSSGCIIASDYTGRSLVPACPPRSLTHSIATAKIVESERSLSLLINYRARISISPGAPSCNLRERYLTERSVAYLRGTRNGQLYRMTVTRGKKRKMREERRKTRYLS